MTQATWSDVHGEPVVRLPPGVPYDMTMNETIQILEGEVTIQIVDGPSYELVPGSIASFAPGTRTRWRFTEAPFKELFVLSSGDAESDDEREA